MRELNMRINLTHGIWMVLGVGCTFPIKNDILDTSDPQGAYGTIDTQEVPNCSYDNLLTRIAVRDYDGIDLDKMKEGTMAYLWAEVANVCDVTIDYQTQTNCLIEQWSISGGGFEDQTYTFLCGDTSEQRQLASGQLIRRLVAPLTELPPGTFELTVQFGINQASGERFKEEMSVQVLSKDD